MTYLIEYLGEFKFIFETILDHESRDGMQNKRHRKSHAWTPLTPSGCQENKASKTNLRLLYFKSSGLL